MKLTKKDRLNARIYQMAEPKQLGDLHQRMKFVMGAMAGVDFQFAFLERFVVEVCPDEGPLLALAIALAERRFGALRMAIFDFETELKFYQPAKPPMGQRAW